MTPESVSVSVDPVPTIGGQFNKREGRRAGRSPAGMLSKPF